MQWLGKAKDFVIDKAKSVGIPIPKIEKTVDPQYNQAKEQFKTIKIDTEKIIGNLIQMNTQLQRIAKSTKKLGDDLSQMFVNAPQNTKNEAISISMFGSQFESFTTNIYMKQIDPNVISPLAVYQKEIQRLKTVKEKRKPARKEYDEIRAKLQAYRDANASYSDVMELDKETQKAFKKYNELNQDFIVNVNRLVMQRAQSLDYPFINLSNLMSQYLLQIFSEMGKMKVSFPPHVFQPRVPMTSVSAAPQPAPVPPPVAAQPLFPPPGMPDPQNPYAGL